MWISFLHFKMVDILHTDKGTNKVFIILIASLPHGLLTNIIWLTRCVPPVVAACLALVAGRLHEGLCSLRVASMALSALISCIRCSIACILQISVSISMPLFKLVSVSARLPKVLSSSLISSPVVWEYMYVGRARGQAFDGWLRMLRPVLPNDSIGCTIALLSFTFGRHCRSR